MSKNVLFVQGGGNGGYEADAKLVASLRKELTTAYNVDYPQMLLDETVQDFSQQWLQQIGKEISSVKGELILAGHSLGASMLLKYLSENEIKKKLPEFFLSRLHIGMEMKTGCSPLSFKKILPPCCRKMYPFFSISVRTMR